MANWNNWNKLIRNAQTHSPWCLFEQWVHGCGFGIGIRAVIFFLAATLSSCGKEESRLPAVPSEAANLNPGFPQDGCFRDLSHRALGPGRNLPRVGEWAQYRRIEERPAGASGTVRVTSRVTLRWVGEEVTGSVVRMRYVREEQLFNAQGGPEGAPIVVTETIPFSQLSQHIYTEDQLRNCQARGGTLEARTLGLPGNPQYWMSSCRIDHPRGGGSQWYGIVPFRLLQERRTHTRTSLRTEQVLEAYCFAG
jgi:hypothetical protein